MRFLRHYLLALQFFTRLPVPERLANWAGFSPTPLSACAAHLPGVGWLVGALAAATFVALRSVLPDVPGAAWVAAVFGTGLSVVLTGALHEDGLINVADGLAGARSRQEALETMRDRRIGVYGGLALLLAVLLKLALLVMLDALDGSRELVAAGLLGAHVVSRFFPLLLLRLLPHVGAAGEADPRSPSEHLGAVHLTVAAAWALAALALLQYLLDDGAWLPPLAAAALAFVGLWGLYARRLQGFTGDCLGAMQQGCELAFYLGLVTSRI